jgi:hypothetical protein
VLFRSYEKKLPNSAKIERSLAPREHLGKKGFHFDGESLRNKGCFFLEAH